MYKLLEEGKDLRQMYLNTPEFKCVEKRLLVAAIIIKLDATYSIYSQLTTVIHTSDFFLMGEPDSVFVKGKQPPRFIFPPQALKGH